MHAICTLLSNRRYGGFWWLGLAMYGFGQPYPCSALHPLDHGLVELQRGLHHRGLAIQQPLLRGLSGWVDGCGCGVGWGGWCTGVEVGGRCVVGLNGGGGGSAAEAWRGLLIQAFTCVALSVAAQPQLQHKHKELQALHRLPAPAPGHPTVVTSSTSGGPPSTAPARWGGAPCQSPPASSTP